ncbi:unnamed protein product [Amoebophrya sp. A120]|nr:unnamed protein product [Amoebophrya sp. A120]|eukprot:GSA120T00018049001.1
MLFSKQYRTKVIRKLVTSRVRFACCISFYLIESLWLYQFELSATSFEASAQVLPNPA